MCLISTHHGHLIAVPSDKHVKLRNGSGSRVYFVHVCPAFIAAGGGGVSNVARLLAMVKVK